ncbi:hypothetical protein CASFOL_029598 [Castilleja foliolosa]|uniref:Uncharacterized protein n=1 Tax=Castilleja foliolosa TaxID=1961234 RepID=A0ABD3C9R5_9LAMI
MSNNKYFYSDSNGKLQFSPNPVKTESSLPAAKASSSSSEESPLLHKKPKLVPSLPVLAAPAPESTDKGKAIVFSGPSPAAKYPMSSPPDEDDWGHQVVDKLAELSKYFLQQRKISRDQSLELRVLAARLRDRDAELKQSRLKAESYERTIASLRRELASSSIAAQKQRIEYGVTVRQSGYTEGFDVGFESGVRAGYEQFPHSPDMREIVEDFRKRIFYRIWHSKLFLEKATPMLRATVESTVKFCQELVDARFPDEGFIFDPTVIRESLPSIVTGWNGDPDEPVDAAWWSEYLTYALGAVHLKGPSVIPSSVPVKKPGDVNADESSDEEN